MKYMYGLIIALLIVTVMLHILGSEHSNNENLRIESELEYGKKRDKDTGEHIRVLLLSTGYRAKIHPVVQVSAAGGLKLSYNDTEEMWESSEMLIIEPDDKRFQDAIIRIETIDEKEELCIHQIERSYGQPTYSGVLELRTTAEGIVIINELSVEDYLCKVVPSEMPASYELEALKAQAVCARSYAYRQMSNYSYTEYEAHVDDSTNFQVYNNSLIQERSSRAVEETAGEKVWHNGEIVAAYFFSTSCGKTTDVSAWGSKRAERNSYLKSVEVEGEHGDYEKELPWYCWEAAVSSEVLSDLISINTGTDVGEIKEINVSKRGAGDIALQIIVTGEKDSVTVDTENKIRAALGGKGYRIKKNDGTSVESTKLLPSAFFTIEKKEKEFVIRGGGYGHGIGMSQNGANEMAKEGKTYKEILQTFYQEVTIE